MKLQSTGQYKYVRKGLQKQTTEHRLVMHEQSPRDNENELVVHHKDGNKANNDPDNLEWMTRSEHSRLHHIGENHFPCSGTDNANYRHGMCVDGQSKEYKSIQNKKTYQKHREKRLAKQKAYAEANREHKSWYDKVRYWQKKLEEAKTAEQRVKCLLMLTELKEAVI